MTDDINGDQWPGTDRAAYLACGNSLSNAEWLMGHYDKAPDDGLALRAFHHLREAEKHLDAALRHHTDAGLRERYRQLFSSLRERVLAAVGAIREGVKITAGRNIDARVRRTTILNLYRLAQMLGHGINDRYRDIATRTRSTPEAIEQALRGYAEPYMNRNIQREDGLLCAFYGIDVETLAGLDKFELVEKVPGLSEAQATALILAARGPEKAGG